MLIERVASGADPRRLIELSFDHKDSLMIALIVPNDVVRKLQQLEIIKTGDPQVPDDEPHITLLYLGKEQATLVDDVEKAVASVVAGRTPLTAKIAGFGRFNKGEDGIPVVAMIDCKGLNLLQADLHHEVARIAVLPSEHGFFPHMTIAYSDTPDYKLPVLEDEVSWQIDSVCVCLGNEEPRQIRFAQ